MIFLQGFIKFDSLIKASPRNRADKNVWNNDNNNRITIHHSTAVLIIVNINKDENKSLISNQFSLKMSPRESKIDLRFG